MDGWMDRWKDGWMNKLNRKTNECGIKMSNYIKIISDLK